MNDEELMEMEIENLTQAYNTLNNRIKELEQINEEHRKLNGQLMNNWDSLKEWVETDNICFEKEFYMGRCVNFQCILDKMNELEKKDKE